MKSKRNSICGSRTHRRKIILLCGKGCNSEFRVSQRGEASTILIGEVMEVLEIGNFILEKGVS